jgi:hypothetical protein
MAAVAFGLAHIPFWGSAFALAADLPFGILMTAVYLGAATSRPTFLRTAQLSPWGY